jgi:hypothetical protein
MKDNAPQCMRTFETSDDVRQQVQRIQDSMAESSRGRFDVSRELDDLKVVVRLTVEFRSYLQLSCTHRFCLEYVCDSIRSGVDSYCNLTHAYKVLVGATESKIKWSSISIPLLKEQFVSMFSEFERETNFENKCRLLLDLFKVQMVVAAVSYD